MEYNVTFSRYGFAAIEADSEEEAYDIAKGYDADDISWSDDFEVSDAQLSDN